MNIILFIHLHLTAKYLNTISLPSKLNKLYNITRTRIYIHLLNFSD